MENRDIMPLFAATSLFILPTDAAVNGMVEHSGHGSHITGSVAVPL